MSLAVLMLCCLLWLASAWSIRQVWKALWERDWMELTWTVGLTVILVFLAVTAGAAHAHWDEVTTLG